MGDGLQPRAHTTFAEVLEALGTTLVASTYWAGKLVFVRARDGVLNTHFRAFEEPVEQVEPRRTHDALFLPAPRYTAGDSRLHEIMWAGKELWVGTT